MENLTKVLITGANGFIGSHLTQRLLSEGFEVGILKRRKSNTWRIKDLLDKIVTYDVDLRDTQEVSKAVSHFRPDAIFHLATYYAVDHQPQEVSLMVDTNVLGTLNLLEASKESAVKLFINTSSCFVYEESKNKLRENNHLNPLNLYALTKIQAEQACSSYAEKYELKTITFRLFPPYGPADHERRLIPYVIKSLLDGEKLKMTTGKQRWDFVFVGDIIEAYLKLLNMPDLPTKHEFFNIGTGNAVSVQEVVTRIKEILGSELEPEWGANPHRKNEVWFTCADISKTKNVLGWHPKIQILGEGLEFTVDWYKHLGKKGKGR
jgi:nucleoside-diphosphate-sugar epimerase